MLELLHHLYENTGFSHIDWRMLVMWLVVAGLLDGLDGRVARLTPAHLAEIDAQADGQMELSRRRLALGLDAED